MVISRLLHFSLPSEPPATLKFKDVRTNQLIDFDQFLDFGTLRYDEYAWFILAVKLKLQN